MTPDRVSPVEGAHATADVRMRRTEVLILPASPWMGGRLARTHHPGPHRGSAGAHTPIDIQATSEAWPPDRQRMSSVEVAPVRVAIVNDYEVVVRGVIGMLHPFRDRVVVVEGSAGLPPFHDVDIVLFDTFSRVSGNGVDQAFMLSVGATKVVVFAWSVQPEAVAQAFAQGATGYLSKGLDAVSLVEALEAVHRGEIITLLDVGWAAGRSEGDWPGSPWAVYRVPGNSGGCLYSLDPRSWRAVTR